MKKTLFTFALALSAVYAMADTLTAQFSDKALTISLTNQTAYCAFQLDVTLPDGITATDVTPVDSRLSQAGSDTEVGGTKFIVRKIIVDDSTIRLAAYNLSNSPVLNSSGDILKVSLSGLIDSKTALTIGNILFTDKSNSSDALLEPVTATYTVPTDIQAVKGTETVSSESTYDVTGRKSNVNAKGISITLKNGQAKKIIIK